MGELWRVRDVATFAALARTPHRARRGPVWVRWVPSPPVGPPRVAFAIGRKAGGAVVRNQLRRRLRAALRALELPDGAYLVGVGGAEASSLSYADLNACLERAVAAAVRRP